MRVLEVSQIKYHLSEKCVPHITVTIGVSSKKKPSSSDEETKTYTVTFQTASGDVFCTQTVEDGKTASKPKLQPSASGSWNYDFTKAVTENIIIKWSAQ